MNKYERYRMHECTRICDKILENRTYTDSQINELRETIGSVRDSENERYIEYKTTKICDRYYNSAIKVGAALRLVPSNDSVTLGEIRDLKSAIELALEYDKGFDAYSTWYTGMRSYDYEDNDYNDSPAQNNLPTFSYNPTLRQLLECMLGINDLPIGSVTSSEAVSILKKNFTLNKSDKGYFIYNPNMRIEMSRYGRPFDITWLRFNITDDETYVEYTVNNTSKGVGQGYADMHNEFSILGIPLNYYGYRDHTQYKGRNIEVSEISHGYDCDDDEEEVDIYIKITI